MHMEIIEEDKRDEDKRNDLVVQLVRTPYF